jgi:hypothetical protein
MQEFVQTNMNEKLPYKEYSTMFTGDIGALIQAFITIQDAHFGFDQVKKFIASEGELS